MIRLDAATVLLQWTVGGMLGCWFTTRRRVVGPGYGWLLRGIYGSLAVGALLVGLGFGAVPLREAASASAAVACAGALVVSISRRRAGVAGRVAEHDRRTARVAAMTGIDRRPSPVERGRRRVEYAPWIDVVPVAVGSVGLVAAAINAGGNEAVALMRTFAGAAFLGTVTDAMLLGHWYLVQPGLPRRLLHELIDVVAWVWPVEVVALLLPTGMVGVWVGNVDDGWGGVLGWFWAACAVTTIVLVGVTKAALRERQYSAVMAATGLLYLAILTAFGTDLVARAVLAA